MTVHRITLSLVLGLLAMAAAPPYCRADIMTYNGVGQFSVVTIHCPGAFLDRESVFASIENVTYRSVDYSAFCVDINHWSGTGPVSERSVLTLPHGDLVAYLFETFGPTIANGTEAAAVQTSIWEVINETDPVFDVTAGHFSVTADGSVTGLANSYLAGMPTSYSPLHSLVVLDSVDLQDMLILIVPEPATGLLLAAGAAWLLKRRRRNADVA